jgi:hypothetical protein
LVYRVIQAHRPCLPTPVVAVDRALPAAASKSEIVGALMGPVKPAEVNGSQDGDPGALTANFPRVYQSCTSNSMNAFKWKTVEHSVLSYWWALKHPKAIGPAFFNYYPNRTLFEINFFLRRVLPLRALQFRNKVPGLKDAKQEKLLKKYEKALERVHYINVQFSPFTTVTWLFESFNTESLNDGLSTEALHAFSSDVYDVNWHQYGPLYCWGILSFILKQKGLEQPKLPPSGAEMFRRANM